MSAFKVIGIVATGAYVASCVMNGRVKTNAYVRAIPAAFACIPELVLRYVEAHGPYPEPNNIFRNRPNAT